MRRRAQLVHAQQDDDVRIGRRDAPAPGRRGRGLRRSGLMRSHFPRLIRVAVRTSLVDSNFAELQFNLKDDSVNKFNAATLQELRQAVDGLKSSEGLQGLLLSSGKDVFIVGADVTEFLSHFQRSEEELAGWPHFGGLSPLN